MSSSSVYEGANVGYEHAATFAQTKLRFMGFDTTIISASGMNSRPDQETEIKERIVGVKRIADKWNQ